ncbi:hypothetical protein [Microbulbifer marinus]|uniref:Lipoprotein n=1 Tax=Microbulbifer marinus TaxID=658218 RepID=A0A1H3YEP8_9GAMM|nr:hypothetical protein [Microbulbifer marinus]SEA09388.1 hypothetical protein SAMN05216562_1687 [Microbulbifer marinus]
MRNVFLPLVLASPLFLAACGQQPAVSGDALSASGAGAHAAIRSEAGARGLLPRRSGLDAVAAAPALNLSGASVYLAPLEIDYRSQDASSLQPIGFRNRTLDASERARLQQTMAQAFAENFLGPRGGRLAAGSGAADYTLRLRLTNFYLPAPLEQTTRLRQVFSESVAYGTLSGTLYDRSGNVVLQFRDRREFGDTFAGSGGERLQRFSPPAFWADMRMDLRRAFSSLDRSLR